jgi:ribulose-5-phosphate 4-epimerase/fuculose-1-phosphate aldolase
VNQTTTPGSARQVEPTSQTRTNLAALYRLFEHHGWSDLTYTHLSARLQTERDQFLLNPYGLLFDEVTASNLVALDFKGHVISGTHRYNAAGLVIHAAVLGARPEINYVIHSHTRAASAVAAMREGLLPISQPALVVRGTLAYHPYGVADEDSGEAARLVADLGTNYVLLLQNHGLLVCGRTAAEAYLYHYFVQTACEIQVDARRATSDLIEPSAAAMDELATWGAPRAKPWGGTQWEAMLRLLDRKGVTYR